MTLKQINSEIQTCKLLLKEEYTIQVAKYLKKYMLKKWLHKIKLEICRLDQVKYSKFTKLSVGKTPPYRNKYYGMNIKSETLILYRAEGKLFDTGDREILVAKHPNLVTLTNAYFKCKNNKK